MTDKYFFEIGVYSLNEDSFHKEYDKRKKKHFDWLFETSGGVPPERAPHSYSWAEQRFFEKYGCWRYNQAIGWIRLYILGSQIRGEYYFVEAKRIRLLMKKTFSWRGKVFELHFFPEDSSKKICREVESELEQLRNEKPFKGRHIDLEAFREIAPFINWRKLIEIGKPVNHWGLSRQ